MHESKQSLAQSWKIFSRVIARKSLVDLYSSLDGIRRSFASLSVQGLNAQGTLDAVRSNGRALTASLKADEAALVHSQGASWVNQVNADAAKLDALCESLMRMDVQRRATESNFSKESQNLVALANATGPLPIGRDDAKDEDATETTSTTIGDPSYAALMFRLSAGVLVLILWITIRTVTSVVGPVRQMRAATRQLAAGKVAVQVKRGGIRELDDLSVSFNQMAEQLADARATARNYQEQLETKVGPADARAAASG